VRREVSINVSYSFLAGLIFLEINGRRHVPAPCSLPFCHKVVIRHERRCTLRIREDYEKGRLLRRVLNPKVIQ